MNSLRRKWAWYAGAGIFAGIAIWSLNYILFLAMESARTYANLPLIRERYYWSLAALGISLAGAAFCIWRGRRARRQTSDT